MARPVMSQDAIGGRAASLLAEERGATLFEYMVILAAIIVPVTVLALTVIGERVADMLAGVLPALGS